VLVFPIGDSPNVPKTPWVTWSLIAVNVLVHLALWPAAFTAANPLAPEYEEYLYVLASERGIRPQVVAESDLIHFQYGAKPGALTLGDAFTSMFLHGGLLHLAGNMLFLWIFGDNVEHRLGRSGFLLAYLGTGVAAVVGDTVLRWGSAVPSIGASGAISGVLGLYFAWFPHNRVRLWGFFFPFFIGTFELAAKWVLGMYLVIDNILPLLLTGGRGGVSYGAHLGGFLAGWAVAKWLAVHPAPRPAQRPSWTQTAERPALGDAFRRALADGDLEQAATILFRGPRRETARALVLRDKVALGAELERAGEPRLALAAYQRALGDHPRDPERAAAHIGAARVLMRGLGSPTAAYQHLYAVLEEGSTPGEEAEARALLRELRGGTRTLPRRFSLD
jgi:membrane associated rhomboid family serine protease